MNAFIIAYILCSYRCQLASAKEDIDVHLPKSAVHKVVVIYTHRQVLRVRHHQPQIMCSIYFSLIIGTFGMYTAVYFLFPFLIIN